MLAKEAWAEKTVIIFTAYAANHNTETVMKVKLATSCGDIVLELHAEKAPNTVKNFISYVESGHYNGTIFHRVIKDFMIQGGGMDAQMKLLPTGDPIQNEADNGLSNVLGSVAMARLPDPHSARAQFFINTTDNAFLDHRNTSDDGWGYCVFGRVTEGMDIVEQIEETSTTSRDGYQDVPEAPITIEEVTVIE
jgi:peptidyl-prolyl cis-trans isomerase B (cyclophilin B)